MVWLTGRTIGVLLLFALTWTGCSRPAGVRSADGGAAAGQPQSPLPEGGSAKAVSHPEATPVADGTGLATDVPFHDPQSLPAGTLLTVRLKTPVSSDSPGASRTFKAVVDEPVVVEGTTLVPRGANVAGRIESARSSTMKQNRGYVRLTLDLVAVQGQDLPVRTTSLFARGASGSPRAGQATRPVSLEEGRRLTFRLSDPVYVVSQSSVPRR